MTLGSWFPSYLKGQDVEKLLETQTAADDASLDKMSRTALAAGIEVAGELKQLRSVQYEGSRALVRMIKAISCDTPIFLEEVDCVLATTKAVFNPAKHAFRKAASNAMSKREMDPSEQQPKSSFKKGVLSEESVRILQEW
jgi:hypothetical protein